MTTLSKRFLPIGAFSLGLVGVLAVFLAFFWTAGAQTVGDGLSGYAWSSNIGWIQTRGTAVNGDAFGVSYSDATNVFSGYAWSSNIGWIHFAPAGPYPEAPSHGVRFDDNNDRLIGWARALSYGGGWDGWIKMSGTNHSINVNSDGILSGYAWGSSVVGWVDFSGVTCNGCISDVVIPQNPLLSVEVGGNGSGVVTSNPTGINCGSDCNERYPSGTNIVLTANPDAGSTVSWLDCPTVDGNVCRLVINNDITIRAQFNSDGGGGGDDTLYNLGVTVNGSGTVTSNPSGINCGNGGNDCDENYTDGITVNLTATPGDGYVFVRWEEACSGGTDCSVVMAGQRSVTAVFEIDEEDEGGEDPFTLNLDGCENIRTSPGGQQYCVIVVQCSSDDVNCYRDEVFSDGFIEVIPSNPDNFSYQMIPRGNISGRPVTLSSCTTNNSSCFDYSGGDTSSLFIKAKELLNTGSNPGSSFLVTVDVVRGQFSLPFVLQYVRPSTTGQ